MSIAAKTYAVDSDDPGATGHGNADQAWYELAMSEADQPEFQRGARISSVVGSGLLMLELTVLSLFLGQLICQMASLVPLQPEHASTAAIHAAMAGMSSVCRILPFCR